MTAPLLGDHSSLNESPTLRVEAGSRIPEHFDHRAVGPAGARSGTSERCAAAFHRAREVCAERLCRKLHRARARRVPEQDMVCDRGGSAGRTATLAVGVQSWVTARETEGPYPNGVCNDLVHFNRGRTAIMRGTPLGVTSTRCLLSRGKTKCLTNLCCHSNSLTTQVDRDLRGVRSCNRPDGRHP